MGTFPKSFKTIEIMQQCRFGFTAEYIQSLVDGWSVVKDYAYIIHNKDIDEDGSPAEDHGHLMLRFKDSVPTNAILAKLQGVCEIQHLQKMHNWKSAIAYLTHSNKPEKHQYADDEVFSNYEWQVDRDDALNNKSKRLEFIIDSIDAGIIREYNYTEHITMAEYTKYKRQIDTAFKYRIDRIKGANRDMECVFITGASGAGKTTYAKMICEDKKYSYYVSSGSNDVLDDYAGQDAIILDDLRPSCMGLSDLLKMLDNNTASTIKSRYRNKVLECRLIIITTVLDIDTYFSKVFESEGESRVQLKRRCRVYLKMDKDKVANYFYNHETRDYTYVNTVRNPVIFTQRKFTFTEALDELQNILGSTQQGLEVLQQNKQFLFTPEELASQTNVVDLIEVDDVEDVFKDDGEPS